MEDIIIINKNDFGIAFLWKRFAVGHHKKINLVFDKNTLHLNEPEVLIFNKCIDTAFNRFIQSPLDGLTLVETPMPQLSLILSYENLVLLQNLVEGTLIELGLNTVLNNDKRIVI